MNLTSFFLQGFRPICSVSLGVTHQVGTPSVLFAGPKIGTGLPGELRNGGSKQSCWSQSRVSRCDGELRRKAKDAKVTANGANRRIREKGELRIYAWSCAQYTSWSCITTGRGPYLRSLKLKSRMTYLIFVFRMLLLFCRYLLHAHTLLKSNLLCLTRAWQAVEIIGRWLYDMLLSNAVRSTRTNKCQNPITNFKLFS